MAKTETQEQKPTDSGAKFATTNNESQQLKCGIVMPISASDGYSSNHWNDVLEIIKDAVKAADFTGDLVSYADESAVIQKNIIQNLYNNPIVIVDVSGKNPNVMFELGLRLAFDKPTIIIKDEQTDYSFDTGIIEHLPYPKSLHYQTIVEFKKKLKEKIVATYKKSTSDDEYSTFLKQFGQFKVAELPSKELSLDKFVLQKLNDIEKLVQHNKQTSIEVKPVKPFSSLSSKTFAKFKNIIHEVFDENQIDYPDPNTCDTFVPIVMNRINKDTGYLLNSGVIRDLIDQVAVERQPF